MLSRAWTAATAVMRLEISLFVLIESEEVDDAWTLEASVSRSSFTSALICAT